MENKLGKFLEPEYVSKYVGTVVVALLVVFETIICMQYGSLNPNVFYIAAVICCCVLMDLLCVANMFFVKIMRTRIILYCFDFLFLLVICTLTGSSYLSALYCIILSQFYVIVEELRYKFSAYLLSCVAYIATFVIGWVINHVGTPIYETTVAIFSGCLVGVLILSAHFIIVLFLLHYYRTNLRLTKALKEADKSKAELEEAYKQLSETAVYEERNRIARDIHDNAGHSMTAVIMQTEAAKLLIDTDPEEAKAKIISANIQAKNALEQMRESVHLLAGRTVARSLKDDIEEIIAQTIDGTGAKIRSSIEDISLSEKKRRFITNSLKECFANGLRHGGATAFFVGLSRGEDCVMLTVSDNGTGLPENFKEGFGIRGIREKAAAFGGSIHYESESGDGLEMCVKLPLDKNEQEEETI